MIDSAEKALLLLCVSTYRARISPLIVPLRSLLPFPVAVMIQNPVREIGIALVIGLSAGFGELQPPTRSPLALAFAFASSLGSVSSPRDCTSDRQLLHFDIAVAQRRTASESPLSLGFEADNSGAAQS